MGVLDEGNLDAQIPIADGGYEKVSGKITGSDPIEATLDEQVRVRDAVRLGAEPLVIDRLLNEGGLRFAVATNGTRLQLAGHAGVLAGYVLVIEDDEGDPEPVPAA